MGGTGLKVSGSYHIECERAKSFPRRKTWSDISRRYRHSSFATCFQTLSKGRCEVREPSTDSSVGMWQMRVCEWLRIRGGMPQKVFAQFPGYSVSLSAECEREEVAWPNPPSARPNAVQSIWRQTYTVGTGILLPSFPTLGALSFVPNEPLPKPLQLVTPWHTDFPVNLFSIPRQETPERSESEEGCIDKKRGGFVCCRTWHDDTCHCRALWFLNFSMTSGCTLVIYKWIFRLLIEQYSDRSWWESGK